MISIITTIYKAEKTLPRLLDSMMALNSPELEFFLIDNGSPDRCGEICAEYAKNDSRFFLYSLKENIGYIKARMLGIKECHGDYVGFCDSDDYLEPEGYDKAVQIIKEQDCDLYIAAHKTHNYGNIYLNPPSHDKGLYEGDAINNIILPPTFGILRGRKRLHGFMWKQICRKSILYDNKINLIEELKPLEDQIFIIDVIQHSKRVFVDDTIIYNYIANIGSVTSSMFRDFDADNFIKKIKMLYIEKNKRAHFQIEINASANTAVSQMELLVLTLCKNQSIFSSELAKILERLFGSDHVIEKIFAVSTNNDLSMRQLFIKFSLRMRLYRFLVFIVRTGFFMKKLF